MKIYGKTDVGLIRRQNQDAFLIGSDNDYCWAVVCDGMGGAAGGDVASSMACDITADLIKRLYKPDMRLSSVKNMLTSALIAANARIYQQASSDSSLMGMGTTIVAAVASGDTLHIVHVGDSRAYKISHNRIKQLTKDHSYVQEMVDMGKISPMQARTHPQKNFITRALGINNNIAVDYDCTNLEKDDIILLCTDGISNLITDDEIIKAALTYNEHELADRLIDLANYRGGYDNSTAVVIFCYEQADEQSNKAEQNTEQQI